MYSTFYSLAQNPFGETPDTRFYFKSKSQSDVFTSIAAMITHNHGFAVITGEIGTGKTLFARVLLKKCERIADTAIILNPALNGDELLRTINRELNVDVANGANMNTHIAALSNRLISNAQATKSTIVFIDEAQNLSIPALESLRLLSNIECEARKLIQIILCGQPELKLLLAMPELRQLNQRISQEVELLPLTRSEIAAYIKCRIDVSGGSNFIRFNDQATDTIFRLTQGTPRLVNILCHRILLLGSENKLRMISEATVNEAASGLSHFKPRRWYEKIFEL